MSTRISHVSIVIVTWNSAAVLPRCLDAIERHPPSLPYDVIVVDNGSTDGTTDGVGPYHRVIANAANRGLPAANNQGMVAVVGDAFLITNPDALVHHGAIDALVDLLDRQPRAGFAIPRLEYEDGRLQTSAGDLPRLREALAGRQAQRRRRAGPGAFWWDDWPHDEERKIGRGHEACYLVRRAAVADIGLQDESFPLDWEGIDWAARAHDGGWQIWFTPSARVTHLGGTSIRQVPVRWVISSHRGMYRYYAKRSTPVAHAPLALLFAGRAAAKLAGMAARMATYERGHGAA